MRRISLTSLKYSLSNLRLKAMVHGEAPIIVESGRGKNKQPVAVLMSYDQFLAMSVRATPELALLREGLPNVKS